MAYNNATTAPYSPQQAEMAKLSMGTWIYNYKLKIRLLDMLAETVKERMGKVINKLFWDALRAKEPQNPYGCPLSGALYEPSGSYSTTRKLTLSHSEGQDFDAKSYYQNLNENRGINSHYRIETSVNVPLDGKCSQGILDAVAVERARYVEALATSEAYLPGIDAWIQNYNEVAAQVAELLKTIPPMDYSISQHATLLQVRRS